MFRLLTISAYYPRPDQASGDLRFYTLLSLLARKYDICFCALDSDGLVLPGNDYSKDLEKLGITIGNGNFPQMLKLHRPDVVWFEFYHQARSDYLALVRRLCPHARVLIDSVDVHFNRLASQASLSGLAEDHAAASRMKDQELAAYSQAELVVAVSDEDARLLRNALPGKAVAVVPNVHAIHPYPDPSKRTPGELIFVGGFGHAPNVDAMLYFCSDVLPLILLAHPEVRLKVIGSNPPDSIRALAGDHVEVLGYVPETAPYLESAFISVAPLRYGGGMKGKVGEAMSFGLPVVTTSFGAEGFGLVIDKDVLVGNTSAEFAAQVIALLENVELHSMVARNGYQFIKEHYSLTQIETKLDTCMQTLMRITPPKRAITKRIKDLFKGIYDRHIEWRFTRS